MRKITAALLALCLLLTALNLTVKLTTRNVTTDVIILAAASDLAIPALIYLSVSLMEYGKRKAGILFSCLCILVFLFVTGWPVFRYYHTQGGRISQGTVRWLIRMFFYGYSVTLADLILLVIYISLSHKYNNHVFSILGVILQLAGILMLWYAAVNRIGLEMPFTGYPLKAAIGIHTTGRPIAWILEVLCVLFRYWPSDRMACTGRTFGRKAYSTGYEYLDDYKQKMKEENIRV